MKRMWMIGFVAAAALLFGCGKSAPAPEGLKAIPDVIKIGIAGPLTGNDAKMGNDVKHGAEMAVEEWNAKGGVLGKKVVAIAKDDEGRSQQAVNVALDLINEDVVGVVGHCNSDCSLPASEQYHKNLLPMISPSCTNPFITDRKYQDVFRVCGRDDTQGKIAADYAVDVLKAKKVAILHNKTQYGQGLADEFKKSLGDRAEVVYYGGFAQEEQNFKPYISTIMEKKPDLWYFGGMYAQGGPLAVQAREAGLTAPFMSGDGVWDPVFLTMAGVAAENSFLTFALDIKKVPNAQSFITEYTKKYGEVGAYSVYGYASADILLWSIQKAGTTEPAKVCDAIRNNPHDCALGQIKFDEKGDIIGSYYVMWAVKDGKFIECK